MDPDQILFRHIVLGHWDAVRSTPVSIIRASRTAVPLAQSLQLPWLVAFLVDAGAPGPTTFHLAGVGAAAPALKISPQESRRTLPYERRDGNGTGEPG